MIKLKGLEHKWQVLCVHTVYGGHGSWWQPGDRYCTTITQAEASAIVAALTTVPEHATAWVVKEFDSEQAEPRLQG